ncbi:MAG: sugar phosphate isomerase/epimerase family protein, partial [Candidatus Hermodarchaeia archaeon]
CSQLILHLSASPGVQSRAALDEARNRIVESLEKITKYAHKNSVDILLENMVIHSNYMRMGSAVQELLKLVTRFQERRVGICIDTGHSLLNKQDPSEDILLAGSYLRALHINDNDGMVDSHLVPGLGVIDWSAVYNALKEVKYSGVFLFGLCGYAAVTETID